MQKKQTILVVASLLLVVLSVTLAYFTAQIIGKGKNVTINSADLKIIFTDSDGSISGTNIEPGKWNVTKTFTIENKSNETYKYNIVIQNLVNTFVTEGYLQYKITSTNGGYNMTEFKDVPKSETATDTILAYSVSIPVGVTQSYTIEFKYANDESVDQSDDMGKTLSGKLFITEGTINIYAGYEKGTLGYQIMGDNITRLTRTDFSKVLTTNNTKTLYTGVEDSKTVYYFAGNATDNWVKFGKNASNQDLYWRIIRTNSDGGVRLLYHGTSTTATDAYIGKSAFNSSSNNIAYVSYMYGSKGSIANARTNQTKSSTIKTAIDSWYISNLEAKGYTKYLSTAAVYCNDRSTSDNTKFGAYTRLNTNKTPSYDCAITEDKFTVDSSTGNGKLTYPIALMTADEVSFAGGPYGTTAQTWYYYNSANGSSTGSNYWWLLSPREFIGSIATVFGVFGSDLPGYLGSSSVHNASVAVRPVISLKSCIKYSTGNGSANEPYTIKETTSGC